MVIAIAIVTISITTMSVFSLIILLFPLQYISTFLDTSLVFSP
ncbi:hypothetical protein YG5714_3010 [Sulfolobus islandicus Y.G.57.14]|uniref:Uncharacterized protein n=4 Tax=Saccharolobus islandicus TaxID=43080 RepID=F0NEJ8_SACI5|nr:hypothetical protein YG5714_3010 [Sulfolobus islandicus Y.G.57.14]ADB86487.1 hypothetical protein LD85_0761 [Sulfolobus islandicus L.D.8.5]ADX82011.1 hypothetical protein SiH_0654 [Sulfolobus islandicus HVE10/4]ADX84760.1 hypothetical protein SiRe_0677 [Sulfolobus islandicus REY15A]